MRPNRARRPRERQNNCSGCGSKSTPTSYADIVRDYEANHKERGVRELRDYAVQASLADVVKLAALAESLDRKRHPHQRRLSASTLRRAHAELDKCQPQKCSSFHELFQMIDNAMGGIHGIGPLTVYDTACRIGVYLRLEPEKVYLHADTREGARALGLGRRVDTLSSNSCQLNFDGFPLPKSKIVSASTRTS